MGSVTKRFLRRENDSGATMVEFALILPVLLLIVLGIINFGYVFGQKLALNQAVREGARRAVVNQSATGTDVQTYVRDATGGMINPASAVGVTTLIQDPNTATGAFSTAATCNAYNRMGGQLQVTAQYQSSWLVALPISLSAPQLTSIAVFRCEVI